MAEKKFLYHGEYKTLAEIQAGLKVSLKASRLTEGFKMIRPGKRCLDVGCHVGYYTKLIKKKFKEVVAIDSQKHYIDLAKLLYAGKGIDYRLLAIEDLKPSTVGQFDCVVMAEVVEHLRSPDLAFRIIHKILRPGGQLIISVPNGNAIRDIISLVFCRNLVQRLKAISKEPKGTGDAREHVGSWDIYTLTRLLEINGFRYDTHRFAGYYPPAGNEFFKKIGLGAEPFFVKWFYGRASTHIILSTKRVRTNA